MKNLFIGTSGFLYKEWFGNFYPKDLSKSRSLDFYCTKFNSVEINSTFYHTVKEKTIESWKKTAGAHFIFTLKASRYITHRKKMKIEKSSIHQFFDPLKPLAKKSNKHCILYQLPANFKKDLDRLESFLKIIPSHFRHAFEFRHPSWFGEDVYQLMKKYKAAVVMNDSPKEGRSRKWPLEEVVTARFFYIRFHGSRKLYSSRYTQSELRHYAEIIKDKLSRKLSVFTYFNNDAEGYAPYDAERLRGLIGRSTPYL